MSFKLAREFMPEHEACLERMRFQHRKVRAKTKIRR
jgi:hypothetical protein